MCVNWFWRSELDTSISNITCSASVKQTFHHSCLYLFIIVPWSQFVCHYSNSCNSAELRLKCISSSLWWWLSLCHARQSHRQFSPTQNSTCAPLYCNLDTYTPPSLLGKREQTKNFFIHTDNHRTFVLCSEYEPQCYNSVANSFIFS